jgi:2-polyprenyl-3-methyl-5-hydroxy-6-metoxy-1,4-benzoquinol methylase
VKKLEKQRIIAYYEKEGKEIKPSGVDIDYRGVFRYVSTHGCRRQILEKWLRAAQPKETFLDVGCELGYFVRQMAEKGLNVTGVDISPTKIRKAKLVAEKLNLNCRFLTMDAESLDFQDSSFDWVLCSETLEHVLNDRRALLELIRVAKQNIIVTVPRQSIFWRALHVFTDVYGFNSSGAGHLREYTVQSLVRLLPKNVEIQEVKKAGFLVSFLDRFLPNFSTLKVILCLKLRKKKTTSS